MMRCLIATIVALLAVVAHNALAQDEEGINLCDAPCINLIYDNFCGGATCIVGASTNEQIIGMCSAQCKGAINGGVMLNCLQRGDPNRPDFPEVQQSIINQIDDFCTEIGIPAPEDFELISFEDAGLDFDAAEASAPAPSPDSVVLPPAPTPQPQTDTETSPAQNAAGLSVAPVPGIVTGPTAPSRPVNQANAPALSPAQGAFAPVADDSVLMALQAGEDSLGPTAAMESATAPASAIPEETAVVDELVAGEVAVAPAPGMATAQTADGPAVDDDTVIGQLDDATALVPSAAPGTAAALAGAPEADAPFGMPGFVDGVADGEDEGLEELEIAEDDLGRRL